MRMLSSNTIFAIKITKKDYNLHHLTKYVLQSQTIFCPPLPTDKCVSFCQTHSKQISPRCLTGVYTTVENLVLIHFKLLKKKLTDLYLNV
jgi:hypothetical protein